MNTLAHPDSRRRPSFMKKKNWFQQHRRLTIVIVALILLAATVFVILFLSNRRESDVDEVQPELAKPTLYYSPLTGRETSQEKTNAPILAVMIENSPEARPQSGLAEAGIVFEAVAEGGITRFVALYQETEPSLVGPVRSVRPYYLDWAAAFDPAVAHVGGSDEALRMARSGNYGVDLDQFYNDSAYWRSRDRQAPHNMYTDYAHLSELAKLKGKSTSQFDGFTRQEIVDNEEDSENTSDDKDEKAQTKSISDDKAKATNVNLTISSGAYAVAYQYDETTATYKRSIGGKPHLNRALDKTETQIAPDVVIAMRVNQTLSSDRVHNQISTTRGGEVFVFQDGQIIKGTWAKSSSSSQIKFLDQENQEIKLKRGQTWITAIPNDKAVTWK